MRCFFSSCCRGDIKQLIQIKFLLGAPFIRPSPACCPLGAAQWYPLAALRSAWAGAHSRYKASAQIPFKPGLMQGRFNGCSVALHTFPHLRETLIALVQIPKQEALRKLLSSSCSCSHLASCSLLLAPCEGPFTQRMVSCTLITCRSSVWLLALS